MEQEELNFERKQFTFYRSFYEAILDIKDNIERAQTYDMICEYALNNVAPDREKLTTLQRIVLRLVSPNLDSARKKAYGGMKSRNNQDEGKIPVRYRKDSGKIPVRYQQDSGNKGEIEIEEEMENEVEVEKETEIKGETLAGESGFDIFWNFYPKKVGKESARAAFEQTYVPLPVLLNAIRKQKQSIQWNRENGQYIPNAATWLSEQRWEDDLPAPSRTGAEVKASGELGNTERSALSQMLGM